MKELVVIDLMLKNEKAIYVSLLLVLVCGFFIFKSQKIKGLYVLAIFIAIKVAVHEYIDDYIDSKKQLEEIKHFHIISVTILLSLLISLPAILISKKVGLSED